jgi:3-phenylpropionate/trans-cinnamate dioxygenase ferredoxin reductase component
MSRHYPYLIVGGGMTADAAVRGIRALDSEQSIGMLCEEPHPPYNRPPLSKGLWRAKRPTPLARIWRGTTSLGVELHLGRKAERLNPERKLVVDDQGQEYHYERLLLATGGTPIRLQPEPHERIIYYRTLDDYHRLRALAETGQRFVVIGGGFIGSEMAAVLADLEKEVSIIFPESGIAARVLPHEISQHLNSLFRQRGIRVLDGQMAVRVQPDDNGVTVYTDQGETLRADGVVAGLGIRPNTGLAEGARIAIENGILVDSAMRTSQPDIFAAGDVANFYNPLLDRRMRVEHEENANLTGMIAGNGMAGQPGDYKTLPGVYSTLFEIHYDAVGELDPRLEIVYDWQVPYQKGAAYYLRAGLVRGVLLWNITGGLETARALIAERKPMHLEELKGRIN